MLYLSDPDVTLHHGDVLATLRDLPAESVDCVVTSPPYWGLRDYGQEGQLGLEPTPERYVERMVEVFREVRRVLAAHGTVWLNLGDSYAGSGKGPSNDSPLDRPYRQMSNIAAAPNRWLSVPQGIKQKDLVGIPWRVAFALQADGWYLRSDIIWAKPNPMPESVTDRPTKAHEYVFLLSKQPRYFFDQEAVRESHTSTRWGGPTITQPPTTKYAEATADGFNGAAEALSRPGREWNAYPEGGRNIRSVWEIATQPYPEAHFATFPEELARRCIAAGCPEWVCKTCGQARERIVEREIPVDPGRSDESKLRDATGLSARAASTARRQLGGNYQKHFDANPRSSSWSHCAHSTIAANLRPGIVLDPFMGSGTVAYVARKLGRHAVGIDLNAEYLELAARRLQQQSLFAETAA